MRPVAMGSPRAKTQSGFTLVELVLVIVLLGVISVATTQFIRQGVGIYTDSIGRDNLQQQARFAIERISRELRNALPGSVRVDSSGAGASAIWCVEFMPIAAASSYLSPVADSAISSLDVIDFSYSYAAGDLLAVYPIDENSVYSSPSALAPLSGASAAAGGVQTLTLSAYQYPSESPTRRFFIVTSPVSFCASDNSLTRHSGYSRTSVQAAPPANGVLLAENIRVSETGAPVTVFDYSAGTPTRSGVVHLDLRFSDTMALGDEWLRFSQEVFVRNTP